MSSIEQLLNASYGLPFSSYQADATMENIDAR